MSMENPEGLGRLSDLIKELTVAMANVLDAEDALKTAKANHRKLSEEQIPELMAELDLVELKLATGHKLSIEKMYFAKIPEDKKAEAFEWLTENHLDSLIKTEIISYFGKGENSNAEQLELDLKDKNINFKSKDNVHAQTLKALVRERMESGEEIPEDLFGIYVRNITKIK